VVQQTAPVSRADRRAFCHAVSLTRLIVHDLHATLETRPAFYAPRSTNLTVGRASRLPEQSGASNQQPGHSHSQQIVQRMLDYIHEHYSRPIQLGDVAAVVNMNAAYVSSLFSTTTGVTFHHYLEELRLAKAKNLLQDPVNRVREVAYAVGYTDPKYFRDVFKARVGISPSAWRERPPGPPAVSKPASSR